MCLSRVKFPGAFSSALFYGIGSAFDNCAKCFTDSGSLKARAFIGKVASHGVAGGVMAELQGGKFGHGFASAGFTQVFSGAIGSIGREGFSISRVLAAAVVGGTASELSGGKFANGAITAAFSRAYNDEKELPKSRTITNADDPSVPENGYETRDAAARAGLSAARSGNRKWEYGGGVVQIDDRFYYTEPVTNKLTGKVRYSLQISEGDIVGIYHTHPNGTGSLAFSPDDVSVAETFFGQGRNIVSYVGFHDDRSIRFYDPSSMSGERIRVDGYKLKNASKGIVLCKKCF